MLIEFNETLHNDANYKNVNKIVSHEQVYYEEDA